MAGGGGGADDNTAQGGHLVAYALRADPGGTGQGHNTNYVAQTITAREGKGPDSDATSTLITHALTSEGADASEDGTGRGTPLVAFGRTNGLDVQASTEITPTLRAGHGVGGGSVASATAVRRLTPVECERLQGYPDGWTATSNGKPQSDSARYRQLGNSIAVPVFEWVARRIVAVDRTVTTTEREN